VYLRQKIVTDVKSSIIGQFDLLEDKLQMGDINLLTTPEVQQMVDMLGNPIDAMIMVTDQNAFKDNPEYEDLFKKASLAQLVPSSSIRCPSTTLSENFPVLGGQTLSGVETFVTELENLGSRQTTRPDCADEVNCYSGAGTTEGAACIAANKFVKAKQVLRDLTYRCDVFVDVDGNECDPKDMVLLNQGQWSKSCLQADGTMQKKEKTCNLPTFVNYIRDFQLRINKTFGRVDKSVANAGPVITSKMKVTVNQYIISPIDVIADGIGCAFLGDAYAQVVEGLCYQGVVGFRAIGKAYVGCAVMALFMILLTYIVWRRAIDNVNAAAKTAPIKNMADLGQP